MANCQRFVINTIFRFETLSLALAAVCLLACGSAKGMASVDLEWNGNPDPSVTGYNVYYGGASHSYTNIVSVGNTTNATVGGLSEGQTYYFAVTAYDAFGDESDFSQETLYVVPGYLTLTPGATPGAPLQVRFPVASGHWYELQMSSDLQTWGTVWEVTGVVNQWVEVDEPSTDPGPEFFRVVIH